MRRGPESVAITVECTVVSVDRGLSLVIDGDTSALTADRNRVRIVARSTSATKLFTMDMISNIVSARDQERSTSPRSGRI